MLSVSPVLHSEMDNKSADSNQESGFLRTSSACLLIAAGILSAVFAFRMSFLPLSSMDTDLWWHMASGRCFIASGCIPSKDPMSFASDVPWLPCEWLCDVILFALMQAGGLDLLIVFRSVMVMTCALLIFGMAAWIMGRSRYGVITALVMSMLAVMALRPFYLIRPQLIAYLLFILFLIPYFAALENTGRDLFTGKPRNSISFIAYIGLLTFVAVNCHPTFIFFPGILMIWLISRWVCEFLKWAPPAPAQTRTVALALLAACLVSLANPLGLRVALHPFDYLVSHIYTRTIAEFLPPSVLTYNAPYFQIFLMLDIVLLFLFLRSKRLAGTIILLIFTRQALISSRYTAYLYILVVPALAVMIAPLLPGIAGRLEPLLKRLGGSMWKALGASAAAMIFFVCSVLLLVQAGHRSLPLGRTVVWDSFPIDTVAFMRFNELRGRLFNAFEWGGYIECERPELKVFIDAQNDSAFSEHVYIDYLRIIRAGRLWKGLLDYYRADMVLLRRTPPVLELNSTIRSSLDWVCIYEDHNAELYVRSGSEYAAPGRLKQLDENTGSAYFCHYLGDQSLRKGDRAEALRLFSRSISKDPYYAQAYVSMGVVLALEGKQQEAVKMWEKALAIDDSVPMANYNIAVFWQNKGDQRKAARYFEREKRLNPSIEIPGQTR